MEYLFNVFFRIGDFLKVCLDLRSVNFTLGRNPLKCIIWFEDSETALKGRLKGLLKGLFELKDFCWASIDSGYFEGFP